MGVVGDDKLEVLALDKIHHRLSLRFGIGCRAPIGPIGWIGTRPLFVQTPMGGKVAVEIYAVCNGDLAVVVVVTQVFSPQPLVGEGILVPVRVAHGDDPHLGCVQHIGDTPIRTEVGSEVIDQAHGHLGGHPLPRVMCGQEQHLGFLAFYFFVGQPHGQQGPVINAVANSFKLAKLGIGRVDFS